MHYDIKENQIGGGDLEYGMKNGPKKDDIHEASLGKGGSNQPVSLNRNTRHTNDHTAQSE